MYDEHERRLLRHEAKIAINPLQVWFTEKLAFTVRRAIEALNAAKAAAEDLENTPLTAADVTWKDRLETFLNAVAPIERIIWDLRGLSVVPRIVSDFRELAADAGGEAGAGGAH